MNGGRPSAVDPGPGSGGLLVDAHAHFHPVFSAGAYLDAAVTHLRRWEDALARSGAESAGTERDGEAARSELCLLLADPEGGRSLPSLCRGAEESGRWAIRSTGEEVSRRAVSAAGDTVHLVAGRQVATSEGLEVLALGIGSGLPEGRAARTTVDAALAAGAVAVVPWGFGKWWLRRGRVVRRLLASVEDPRFFLGDNGGRPRAAPEPALFRTARERGVGVLPGSDPLPFEIEQGRAGSYGFALPDFDPGQRPFRALRDRLSALEGSPPAVGRRVGLGRFLALQLRMQLRKRTRR
mgnify:CR=1 FL=1